MGSSGFLLIVIAFAFLYFVLIRPQKKRQIAAQRLLSSLAVGDEVVTSGGVYGTITELGDEDVKVRIAPEVEVRIARRAIGAIVPQDEPEEASDEPEEGPTPGT
ncbi:MAG TPA: preprotein translocase subunit YajC [Gaiellaceae bacterium]|nr:preprotein translocase subunit YajC [Gaiellaceae bacterium]